jgi:hypothetical protein
MFKISMVIVHVPQKHPRLQKTSPVLVVEPDILDDDVPAIEFFDSLKQNYSEN